MNTRAASNKLTGPHSSIVPKTRSSLAVYEDIASRKRKLEACSAASRCASRQKRAAFGDITNATNYPVRDKKAAKKKSHKEEVLLAVVKEAREVKSSQEENDVSYDVLEVSRTSSQKSCSSAISLSQELGSQEVPFETIVEEEPDWVDVDAEHLNDVYYLGLYAPDIFQYYLDSEKLFPVDNYMLRQLDLTVAMRAILVDWMVEIQENFELNHETLYLAIRIVDRFLCREIVTRDKLQLVGASSLLVACKFDERCPPALDDYLYVCDDAYTRAQMIEMEIKILRVLDFSLGMPLSYRFLRRFSKCAHSSNATLTLARYILEMSLMDCDFMCVLPSKMAAACLWLALQMKGECNWDGTMLHYTTYEATDLLDLALKLNGVIASPPNKRLSTIRSKYSHEVFQCVALISPLSIDQVRAKIL